jgi:hypothetical protein
VLRPLPGHKFGAEKPISGTKPEHFHFLAINLYCLESHTEHRWRCSNMGIQACGFRSKHRFKKFHIGFLGSITTFGA